MRPRVLVTLLAAVAALALPSPAAADVLRECGSYGYVEDEDRTGWTHGPIAGAGISNVTTRRVTCRWARRFVRSWDGQIGDRRHRRFRCRFVSVSYEFADIRCRRARKVIRWQTGS